MAWKAKNSQFSLKPDFPQAYFHLCTFYCQYIYTQMKTNEVICNLCKKKKNQAPSYIEKKSNDYCNVIFKFCFPITFSEWINPKLSSVISCCIILSVGLPLFSPSVVSDTLRPMDWSTPSSHVLHHFLELAQTHVHWVGDAIQPSWPPLLLPSIFPSIRVFSNESVLLKWPKYWSFSFSISSSSEYSGLISFRTDWLDKVS